MVVQELLQFSKSQFVFSSAFPDLESALRSGPGILDLFSGSRGLSRACCRAAATWSLTFDIDHSPRENLLNKSLQGKLSNLVRSGAFFAMVAGPVCASFSTAITPPCRTLEYPAGTPWCSPLQQFKNEQGNAMLRFVLQIVMVCLESAVLFLVENPDSSWLWRQTDRGLSWKPLMDRHPEVGDLRLDFCRFGTAWRKRTKVQMQLRRGWTDGFLQMLDPACCPPWSLRRKRGQLYEVGRTLPSKTVWDVGCSYSDSSRFFRKGEEIGYCLLRQSGT